MVNEETLRRFHEYVRTKGFGLPVENLTISMPHDVFIQSYYKKEQLRAFCHQYGLSSAGSKHDLTKRIEYFLRTGSIKHDHRKPIKGRADSQQTIMLDTQVVNYKSDAKTRAFFENNMPDFNGFSAWVQNKIRERLVNGDIFTYADVIEMHRAFLRQKDQAKAMGKPIKVANDSCQFNQFAIDYKNDIHAKPHSLRAAWLLVRDTVGEQTYQRYQNRVIEIFRLIQKNDSNQSH